MVCLKESAEAKAILVAFCLFCVLVASSILWTNSWVATRRYKNMLRDDNVHMKTLESVIFIPSRSSMDFSSLATVLSANSARVSAWQNTLELLRDFKKQNWNSWHYLEHFHVIFQRKNCKCQIGSISHLFHLRYSTGASERFFETDHAISWTALHQPHLLEFVSQNFDLFLVLVLFFWILWRETNGISKMSPQRWITER